MGSDSLPRVCWVICEPRPLGETIGIKSGTSPERGVSMWPH